MLGIGKKVRSLRQKIDFYVSQFHQFWRYDPNALDQFGFLDVLLTFGGYHCKLSKKWPRRFWYFSVAQALFQYGFVLWKTFEVVRSSSEYLSTVWYLTLSVIFTLCWIIVVMLIYDRDNIDAIRRFVNLQTVHSGDPAFDATARGRFFRFMQRIIAGMFAVGFVNQIGFLVPTAQRDRIFGMPQFVYSYDAIVVQVVNFVYMSTFAIIWATKYFICSGVVFSLLVAIRAELEIINHGFERILEEVDAKVQDVLNRDLVAVKLLANVNSESTNDLRSAQKPSLQERSATLFWKYLAEQIAVVVDQHNKTLGNLNLLKTVATKTFVINFYFTFTAVASIIFIVLNEKFSFYSIMFACGTSSFLFHIYVWCYLVESLQDVNESIEASIYDICYALLVQYGDSRQHHRSEHKQAQMGLMAAALATRNSAEFNCFELFRISNELFLDLVNTSYSVFTFLVDMRK